MKDKFDDSKLKKKIIYETLHYPCILIKFLKKLSSK